MKLRCTDCRGAFKWEGPWPTECPLCHANIGMGDRPEVAAPHISSGRAKALSQSADQTYRGMEAAGDANAAAAAEMLGVPASDMADLRITNLQDNLREGDQAIKAPNNEVSRLMQTPAVRNVTGLQPAASAQYFAEMTPKTGQDARAGFRAASTLRGFHARTGAGIVAAGETEPSRRARKG